MSMRQSLRTLRFTTRPTPTLLWNKQLFATMAEPTRSTEASAGSVEQTIREKITSKFVPTRFEIYNDSHLHKHHKAMADSTSAETHFRLVITSSQFQGLTQIKRHRMVNELLKEDMAREGGIHALQMRTMTPEEDKKRSE